MRLALRQAGCGKVVPVMAVSSRSRIVVAGAGSIGCYVGGCLALAGRHVALLLRPALADAIARHGLCIADLGGSERAVLPTALQLASDPAAALSRAEIVLLTVKCGATAQMAGLIARHAPADAVVVSLQNGVGNLEVLRTHLATSQRALAGMVPFNVVPTRVAGAAPRFHRATSGTLLIASGVAGLREALDVPGAAVAERDDMVNVLWSKLLLNLNNALNALSDLPLAAEMADRRWRLLLAAQVQEALAVLRAAGVGAARIESVPPQAIPFILRLPDWLFRLVARRMLAIDPQARSSMWEDLRLRRPTEIDYLQGAILALAEKRRMAAPITGRVLRLIKGAEKAGAGSPALRPEQVASAQ
jgi:2-dehydropantoate 2-reductase